MSNIYDNNQKPGDKRTLIAVVLSVIVITVGFLVQGMLFPPAPQAAPAAAASSPAPAAPAAAPGAAATGITAAGSVPVAAPATAPVAAAPVATTGLSIEAPVAERTYTISTDILEATFTNKGGDLVSLKLKKHRDKDGAVDLIVAGSGASQGLSVAFGPYGTAPVTDLLNARMLDDRTIEFSRTFLATVPGKAEPVPFAYKKVFSFRDGDYLFGMAVSFKNSVNEYLPLDKGGSAYTVSIGPQIGPRLSDLSKNARADFRKFITYTGGKKHEERPKAGVAYNPKEQPSWAAISGKYFAFVAVPELAGFTTTMLNAPDPSVVQRDELSLTRPAIKASEQTDTYYFYFGPKTDAALKKYNFAKDNAFQRKDFHLENVVESSNILGWLEWLLKKALDLFYFLVPNYGVAIILVTILVKALMFPLTKKGSVASARMQELQPQMAELQAKYKSNPQKLNQEMAEFYKREGYNPMSGCLPLLIQFPLFIAMYNLFNNHFELRGAMFIPGWIPDLSQPEAIFSFPTINLVIWKLSAIRVLPVVYLLSQLFYGKFTQNSAATGQSAAQMKFMMYGMPIMFFFILYDVPSGLLIYWIFSNLIQIGQQVVINDFLKKRKLEVAAAGGPSAQKANKIAPNKGGKGKK